MKRRRQGSRHMKIKRRKRLAVKKDSYRMKTNEYEERRRINNTVRRLQGNRNTNKRTKKIFALKKHTNMKKQMKKEDEEPIRDVDCKEVDTRKYKEGRDSP